MEIFEEAKLDRLNFNVELILRHFKIKKEAYDESLQFSNITEEDRVNETIDVPEWLTEELGEKIWEEISK